ncbi:unnamed protein product [Periconia digitata]|uniref:Uncharacterized protein n=1 Tax=Periconia digitata TaxID=1303443 RepID=A0A9W4U8P3_9PLEO|nr:unnamed protein product [Periconia digitata]
MQGRRCLFDNASIHLPSLLLCIHYLAGGTITALDGYMYRLSIYTIPSQRQFLPASVFRPHIGFILLPSPHPSSHIFEFLFNGSMLSDLKRKTSPLRSALHSTPSLLCLASWLRGERERK